MSSDVIVHTENDLFVVAWAAFLSLYEKAGMAEYNASKSGWGFTHHHCRVVGGALIQVNNQFASIHAKSQCKKQGRWETGGGGGGVSKCVEPSYEVIWWPDPHGKKLDIVS